MIYPILALTLTLLAIVLLDVSFSDTSYVLHRARNYLIAILTKETSTRSPSIRHRKQ